MTSSDLFESALAAWHQGQIDQAAELSEQVLAIHPEHAYALHLLGIVAMNRGQPDVARELVRRALSHHEDENFYSTLGVLLDAPHEVAESEAALRRAIELNPASVNAYNNLGNTLRRAKRIPEAEAAFQKAIALDPDSASPHYNLGNMLLDIGQTARAEIELRRTIELKPDAVGAYNNLSLLLSGTGRFNEAEAALRHALTLDPGFIESLNNLGNLLTTVGRLDEAEVVLRRAIELNPDYVSALNNLSNVLSGTGRMAEAETILRRAIELSPNFATAHSNLGNILKNTGRLDEAIMSYRRAIELDPSCIGAHSNLVYALTFRTEDGNAIRAECEQFAKQFEAPLLAEPVNYPNDRSPTRRLRIGYVSPDFYNHCQSFFTTPLLKNHDHQAYEIFCYASVLRPDPVTQSLMPFADVWRDVCGLDDEQLARQIRDDRIDILIDLTMHMAHGRPQLFARRPAPVQVAWLAYPGTTGSRAIGYRLTDPWLDPVGDPAIDAQYTECSIRLPDTFWCYDPLTSEPDVNPLPALKAGHITFGCLNNPCKLTDHTLQLWSAVLNAVPGSTFILMYPSGTPREQLVARLATHGIDIARMRFVEHQPRNDYLRTYHEIDLALDTFPYNGHTTSLDAFWMGVPVVTRVGRSVVGRGGLSLLANLGLPELAAQTDDEYVQTVTGLVNDLPRLAALRAGLRARIEHSPLMDGARFARGIEQAYRQMWNAWCTS